MEKKWFRVRMEFNSFGIYEVYEDAILAETSTQAFAFAVWNWPDGSNFEVLGAA
jgi:hypothetical protein